VAERFIYLMFQECVEWLGVKEAVA